VTLSHEETYYIHILNVSPVFAELVFADEARCLSVYVWGVVMLCVCCVYLRVLFAFNTFAKTYVVL